MKKVIYVASFTLVALDKEKATGVDWILTSQEAFASKVMRDEWMERKRRVWVDEAEAGTHLVQTDTSEEIIETDDLVDAIREYEVEMKETLVRTHTFTIEAESEHEAEGLAESVAGEFDWDYADDTCYSCDLEIEDIREV